ncbi:hypothetical protein BJX61DRAFT_494759 [Aspergillus egyptiacus]|nr:hypothetical protein BJX61DRAFT_494759 [Aspergillus egyptiacus]
MKLTAQFISLIPFILSSAAAAGESNSIGCFTDGSQFDNQGPYTFQSIGYCKDRCSRADKVYRYAALQGENCFCASEDPAQDTLVADDRCDVQCAGFARDICGGDGVWSVYGIDGATTSTGSESETGTSTEAASGSMSIVTSTPVESSGSTSSTVDPVTESTTQTVSTTPEDASTSPTSTTTGDEHIPTGNSANRRYSFLF